MNELCLIIQGSSNDVNTLKNIYKNVNIPIIFSTWEGEESKYDINDIVIFNKMPSERGIQNVMLQRLSTYSGLLKAKEMGFKYAIKIRGDAYFTNLSLFLKNNIDYDKLNFLFFLNHYREGGPCPSNNYKYFCDYLQISNIDNLLKMWNFKYERCYYPEQLITKHVFNTFKNEEISFIGQYLTNECDIYWISRALYLSTLLHPESIYKINI